MPKKVKDPQANGVYDAMRVVDSSALDTSEDIMAFLNSFIGTKWFQSRWPIDGINFRDGRGRDEAMGQSLEFGEAVVGYIALPKGYRWKHYAIHELAHVCDTRADAECAHHDKIFVGIYLAICRHVLGRRWTRRFQAELRREGVEWTIYRKR